MEKQQKLEPWQIRIICKRRKLQKERAKVHKLEENNGKEEEIEKLFMDLRRSSRSITYMLKHQPKHLPVDARDCLTDFQRCVDSLTAYGKETQSILTEYMVTLKSETDKPDDKSNPDKTDETNNAKRFNLQDIANRASIIGGGITGVSFLSFGIGDMFGVLTKEKLLIIAGSSLLIFGGIAARDILKNISETRKIEQDSAEKTNSRQINNEQARVIPQLRLPGINL